MSYHLYHTPEIIFIKYDGVFDDAMLRRLTVEQAQIEQSYPVVPHRIADFREIDVFAVNWEEILRHAHRRRIAELANPVKSALVVGNQLVYGYMRMFQTLNTNPKIELRIFYEMEEACAWVGIDPALIAEWVQAHHDTPD